MSKGWKDMGVEMYLVLISEKILDMFVDARLHGYISLVSKLVRVSMVF